MRENCQTSFQLSLAKEGQLVASIENIMLTPTAY